jgi:hypothetical protein
MRTYHFHRNDFNETKLRAGIQIAVTSQSLLGVEITPGCIRETWKEPIRNDTSILTDKTRTVGKIQNVSIEQATTGIYRIVPEKTKTDQILILWRFRLGHSGCEGLSPVFLEGTELSDAKIIAMSAEMMDDLKRDKNIPRNDQNPIKEALVVFDLGGGSVKLLFMYKHEEAATQIHPFEIKLEYDRLIGVKELRKF